MSDNHNSSKADKAMAWTVDKAVRALRDFATRLNEQAHILAYPAENLPADDIEESAPTTPASVLKHTETIASNLVRVVKDIRSQLG